MDDSLQSDSWLPDKQTSDGAEADEQNSYEILTSLFNSVDAAGAASGSDESNGTIDFGLPEDSAAEVSADDSADLVHNEWAEAIHGDAADDAADDSGTSANAAATTGYSFMTDRSDSSDFAPSAGGVASLSVPMIDGAAVAATAAKDFASPVSVDAAGDAAAGDTDAAAGLLSDMRDMSGEQDRDVDFVPILFPEHRGEHARSNDDSALPKLSGAGLGVDRSSTTVLVICGGFSHERDVSIASGHRVGGFLEESGWNVAFHDMDGDLLNYLADPATRPDIVWPLLHGAIGEDGSIRDILEMEGLPYIGSRPKASRTAWSKPIAKNMVRKLGGLSTPHSVTLPEAMFRELGAGRVVDLLVKSLQLPLFVKPTMGGSALGCTRVDDAAQLPQAMVDCFAYGDVALVEQAVAGTEISVSILDIGGESLVLPPLEVSTPEGRYDYEARIVPGPTDFYVPARLPQETLKAAQTAAKKAHETLGLRDISRTDFIVDEQGVPQFLEANVAPGMTSTSQLPQAAVAAGYNLGDLYSYLVESVLNEHRA